MKLSGIQVERLYQLSDGDEISVTEKDSGIRVRRTDEGQEQIFQIGPRGGITPLTKHDDRQTPKGETVEENFGWKPLAARS